MKACIDIQLLCDLNSLLRSYADNSLHNYMENKKYLAPNLATFYSHYESV